MQVDVWLCPGVMAVRMREVRARVSVDFSVCSLCFYLLTTWSSFQKPKCEVFLIPTLI